MNPEVIDGLADDLVATQLGERLVQRVPIRVWSLSGVERMQLGRRSVIFKYARAPFDDEDRILAHVARYGLEVPRLLASAHWNGTLGMLLQDLGAPDRSPTLAEAARTAVAVHTLPAPEGVPVLDADALATLPERALGHLNALRRHGRWARSETIAKGLGQLAAVAHRRSRDAQRPPYGLVHSEFHESSVHIDTCGQLRVLDMARAFVGPGLFDLVSWQGTTTAPNPYALRNLLHAYIRAGGPEEVVVDRAGFSAEHWALGWHRLWTVAWYLEQAYWWDPRPDVEEHDQTVVHRHVLEAQACLKAM